jgi:hypothetical protein
MSLPALPALCLVLVVSVSGCATLPKEKLYPATASLLPGTEAAMTNAGYWISLHNAPDTPILDSAGIAALNASIRATGIVRDLSTLPPKTAEELTKELNGTVGWVASLKVYQANGKKVSRAFLAPLSELMAIEKVGIEPLSYGFLVGQTDLRVLPTTAPLYDGRGDPFIDNLQVSSLEPGTPLVILHRSRDGAWLYVATELVTGWLDSREVAAADFASFLRRYKEPSVIVTAARVDLFEDAELRRFIAYARMGTRLVLAGPTGGAKLKIRLPRRDETGLYHEREAWVDAGLVSAEPLPYTPRSIYRQAFALLNAPYGWGGTFGEQDCSQFLAQVFSTVGIILPRNSARQAKVGVPLAGLNASASDEDKRRIIVEGALGGATFLRFPGHIMLYLGSVAGEPYVIHSTWSYQEKRGFTEVTRLINRVAVSNLELGSLSKRGSHLHRLTNATTVTSP